MAASAAPFCVHFQRSRRQTRSSVFSSGSPGSGRRRVLTNHRSKGDKQQPGGEFGKQSSAKAQAEPHGGGARRLPPKVRELPEGEQAEQGYGDVGMHQRPESEEDRRTHIGGKGKQPTPITPQLPRENENRPPQTQRRSRHGPCSQARVRCGSFHRSSNHSPIAIPPERRAA